MSFFNTGNPVPSNDPRDLDDNAMHVDELVNSTELTYTDRLGAERLTMAGIEAEAASSATLRSDLAADDGSDLVGFVAAGTGAEARTAQDKMRETQISVTDYMTDAERADAITGTPLLNHVGAFTDFLTAVALRGDRGRIPRGTYKLDTNVLGNWSQVIELDEDAVITGAGILYAVQRIDNKPLGSKESRFGSPNPASGNAIGRYFDTAGDGAGNSYGVRFDYRGTATVTSGFSLGIGNIAHWDSIDGGAGQGFWQAISTPPLASGGQWGVVIEELNITNRGPDQGYRKTRGSTTRWCGGIQVVPEAIDLAGSTGNNVGNNVLFAFCTAHSGGVGASGFQVKVYNGLLVERDSIGPLGRGALFSGDTSGVVGQIPAYGVEIDQRWEQGINTTAASFTGNIAINLADNHVLTWGAAAGGPQIIGSQTTGVLKLASAGSGAIQMVPGNTGIGAMQFAVVASSVNILSVNGATTGFAPRITAAGSDTNIDFQLAPKGTGVLDYLKAAVAATTPANFTATHMVDIKFNGVAYKIPARVAAW